MGKYATFEEELDAIRDALYEKTKHMTTEEHLAYIKAKSSKVMKEFNIKYCGLKPIIPFSGGRREE